VREGGQGKICYGSRGEAREENGREEKKKRQLLQTPSFGFEADGTFGPKKEGKEEVKGRRLRSTEGDPKDPNENRPRKNLKIAQWVGREYGSWEVTPVCEGPIQKRESGIKTENQRSAARHAPKPTRSALPDSSRR